MAEWSLVTNQPTPEQTFPEYTCLDCGNPITVKQYQRLDANGDHHHVEPWDCPCGLIDELEVMRETERNLKQRRMIKGRSHK